MVRNTPYLFITPSDRHMPVTQLPLLTATEHQQSVYDWNATEAPYAAGLPVNTRLAKASTW